MKRRQHGETQRGSAPAPNQHPIDNSRESERPRRSEARNPRSKEDAKLAFRATSRSGVRHPLQAQLLVDNSLEAERPGGATS
ncbi:hypothetical protein F2Q69_00003446 [Brassica cretica]|uniref:Uncharacterized protein n=1 Tax=Brassica cretica TaxID=69181 RepID=A0A8S9NSI4_BRACR|nr:hypothetical protein F2Q69_00003446 [Brassica cretica]